MTIDLNRLASVLRQLAAVASTVIGALGTGGLPAGVRAALVAGGGILLTAEHLISGLSTVAGGSSATTSTTQPSPAPQPAPAATPAPVIAPGISVATTAPTPAPTASWTPQTPVRTVQA